MIEKLGFYATLFFFSASLADAITTVIGVGYLGLHEKNPLGYPLCLIAILLFPVILIMVGYVIQKREATWLKCASVFLVGMVLPMSIRSLDAVIHNVGVLLPFL